jgi:AcrR family transcriptional regulator
MRSKDDILSEVVERYLGSGDFNGRFTDDRSYNEVELELVRQLILEGAIEVVAEADFPNPSIRPWPSRRSPQDQVADLETLEVQPICLYPTSSALVQHPDVVELGQEPYRQAMASGRGQLELSFFECQVLEQYRNDPRFRYWFLDVEIYIGVSDDVYLDELEPDRDKIGSVRVGVGYDMSTIRTNLVRRFVCCFYRDLADLTPQHQQRWKTFEIERLEDYHPHPMWWAEMMGEWVDTIGPFQKMKLEMEAINALFDLSYSENLFRTTEIPRELGWVLRPSTTEWQQFVLALDKFLSDNLQHESLSTAGVDRNDAAGDPMGTLQRLELYLTGNGITQVQARELVDAFRLVRRERMAPAHELHVPSTEPAIIARQRDVLSLIIDSLIGVRRSLMTLPAAASWAPDDLIEGKWYAL